MTSKPQVRTRCSPYGQVTHDVFAPEDSSWRAAAEFWLYARPGDCLFTDAGNADDWLGFCADVAKREKESTALEDICTCEFGVPLGDGRTDTSRCPVHDMTREELLEYAANGWREVIRLEESRAAAKKRTDNFAIIESALLFYAESPVEDQFNPPGPNPVLVHDSGAKARMALEALDRLTAEWAERSAFALRRARDMIRRDDHD